MAVNFDVLIDDTYCNLFSDSNNDFQNKRALSFINDFENGSWRFIQFMSFLYNNMSLTALSANEREVLIEAPYDILAEAARNIKISDKGGEIGEILLYGIMKQHFKALSINAKIFYKQNTHDPAKGADSVHIVISKNKYSLWLGEAKFYGDITKAIPKAIESVKDLLNTPDKIKKERELIINFGDLDIELSKKDVSSDIKDEIKKLLDPSSSLDHLKQVLNIPILILYECSETNNHTQLSDDYREKIKTQQIENIKRYFTKHYEECKNIFLYQSIKFHLILFPVPNKQNIVDQFNKKIQNFKE
jgi:hypothetical protein